MEENLEARIQNISNCQRKLDIITATLEKKKMQQEPAPKVCSPIIYRVATHFNYPAPALQDELRKIAAALIAPGKGILVTDESIGTMGKRFQEINIDNNDENRRKYRQILFTTDISVGDYISGVVMFHETLYQKADDSTSFVELLKDRGIIPGIKVDSGVVPLWGSEDETTTQGLDDLAKRCAQYKKDGCHFAKWRSVFKISSTTPSYQAVLENANVLARFASICQSNRLVPVVQSEVLSEGNHDIERAQKVTETVLSFIFKALHDHNIFLEGLLLQPSMVTPGALSNLKMGPEAIAKATVTAISRTVPPAVPGIVFLSGGQTEAEATLNLNAINNFPAKKPWTTSFCFGRALQNPVVKIWSGKDENVHAAQVELLSRARANSEAALGKYIPSCTLGQECM